VKVYGDSHTKGGGAAAGAGSVTGRRFFGARSGPYPLPIGSIVALPTMAESRAPI